MAKDTGTQTILVAASEDGQRVDRVLAQHAGLSRSRLKALILAGEIAIDGRTIRDPAHRVNAGAAITVRVPPPADPVPGPEAIALAVVYEDAELIVIDKPAGLVVHPAAGNWTGTLVNALIAHCGDSLSGIGGVKRPGIVHRLDKDTSGLLVVAKTDAAHRALAAQFADHGRAGPLERGYLGFVWGAPDRPKGRIEAEIARHPHARDKMTVPALCAAALEPRIAKLYLVRHLESWRSIAETENYTCPLANLVPDALRVTDIPEIASMGPDSRPRRRCSARNPATPWPGLIARPFMPIYWASNIRKPGIFSSSVRNCRPSSPVYATAWPKTARRRPPGSVNQPTNNGLLVGPRPAGHVDLTLQALMSGAFVVCCTANGICGRINGAIGSGSVGTTRPPILSGA